LGALVEDIHTTFVSTIAAARGKTVEEVCWTVFARPLILAPQGSTVAAVMGQDPVIAAGVLVRGLRLQEEGLKVKFDCVRMIPGEGEGSCGAGAATAVLTVHGAALK
jgi:hypothetical protein